MYAIRSYYGGFEGLIISDWYGTYSADTPAGELDLEMPGPSRWMSVEHVSAAVDAGKLTEDDINAKVYRLLATIERAGLFENPQLEPERSLNSYNFV